MANIYVLLSSFNRLDKTILCIQSVLAQVVIGYEIKIILFDDGSTDGTTDNVMKNFPSVSLLLGNSSNYWCRSMYKAYQFIADQLSDHDFIFCLNDDVSLYEHSLQNLLSQFSELKNNEGSVIAGRFENSKGLLTYGGLQRIGGIKYMLESQGNSKVDTLNFNGVLIPGFIINNNGFLDPKFEHSMGDIEYGLRLTAQKISIMTSSNILGRCESNDLTDYFSNLNFYRRFRLSLSKKYFPPKSWLYFTIKTCGRVWPVYFLYPYIKFTFVGKK